MTPVSWRVCRRSGPTWRPGIRSWWCRRGGRAFRTADLLELAELVAGLRRSAGSGAGDCQADYAVSVQRIPPLWSRGWSSGWLRAMTVMFACPAGYSPDAGGVPRMIPLIHCGIVIMDTTAAPGGGMARRDDGKTQALAASRTLNPRPEKVTDPAFGPGGFFDPADLVQVKYEMVRTAEGGRRAGRPRPPPPSGSPASRSTRPGRRCAERAGRADPGQARSQGRPQAHRGGRGPCWRTCWSRSPAAAGGAGRRGPAAFRRQRASALGRTRAAAPPARPEPPAGQARAAAPKS